MWPIVGQDKLIEGYEIRPIEGNYFRKFLPVDEIVVFKDKSPISKIDGYSPLTAGAQWGDTMEMINRSRWHAYKNGTFPTVAVQFDGKFQDPSDEDLRRIESKFMSRYTGETRSNRPMFLPPGVSVNPISLGINQMLFGETANEVRDNLLALFGVPASAAGLSKDMTYGSVMASHAGFMQQTINPLLRYFGQVITEKVAHRYDESLKVWWEDITPHDPELVEKQIQTDLMCGAITPNEVRIMRGRQPFPTAWGDNPILPVNVASNPMGGTHAPVPAPLSNPNDNRG
jgi:HK97 family phage portal protein